MRLAYLYSRYPVLSQTFCDTEMLELERRGVDIFIGSVHPPLTSMRHAHAQQLKARVQYAPPTPVVQLWENHAKANGTWPKLLVERHERRYGEAFKAALRARNASYFAELFAREGIQHFHVHFANRAAHTALFVKALSGIPFSITAHGQDFMIDLGNDELLREICAEAEFIAVETDFSRDLLAARCPESAGKMLRVYNGMALENFPLSPPAAYFAELPKIVSVGRLVEFKGFTHLIAACSELKRLGFAFTCEIIGDGPLRESLQTQIDAAALGGTVQLRGALPQQTVFDRLRGSDIFALASIVDSGGASDVFPTVILEAMAASRPVISTQLAGIPEAVVHGTTGLLVPPADSSALTQAIARLLTDQWSRVEFGNAGRARIERSFQVSATIEPLLAQFEQIRSRLPQPPPRTPRKVESARVAYIIERWPDADLPMLEDEMLELAKRGVPAAGFICEFRADEHLTEEMQRLALELEYLPDAMAIEAQWQADRALGYKLEDDRAHQKHRASAALYLQQARYAVALRALLKERPIRHVHATSSRALLCAVMLKKLFGVTVSATIEPEPAIPVRVIRAALAECDGGRVSDPGLKAHLGSSFLSESSKLFRTVRLDLRGQTRLWQEWTALLKQWQ